MDTAEGYLTLAVGNQKYPTLATNVAKSLRLKDPKRPIALATTASTYISPEVADWFDRIVILDDEPYEGVEFKLAAFNASPFSWTMFLDSDVLLFKDNADYFWQSLRGTPLTYAAVKRYSGDWFGKIEDKCKIAGSNYIWTGNSGVVYFENSARGLEITKYMTTMFNERKKEISSPFFRGGYADEPFIAVALAAHGLEAYPITDAAGLQWHFATVNAANFDVDFCTGRAAFRKAGVVVDPTFLHFSGIEIGCGDAIDVAYRSSLVQIQRMLGEP